jgi:hypothetical protein
MRHQAQKADGKWGKENAGHYCQPNIFPDRHIFQLATEQFLDFASFY